MPMMLEEGVAYLEGKVEEHTYAWQDLRERIIQLEKTLNERLIGLEERMDRRLEAIDQRLNRYFLGIIGIQVSVLPAIVASLLR
jgi:hypothetical protein